MQPLSIERKENYIHILWSDQHPSIYEVGYLRRRCPCVVCRGIKERSPDGGIPVEQIPQPVELISAHLVGNYALQLNFNAGHDTGIYSFEHLRKICACPQCQPSA